MVLGKKYQYVASVITRASSPVDIFATIFHSSMFKIKYLINLGSTWLYCSILIILLVKKYWEDWRHRWAVPVLRYPRNMVICHYPLIGVIFMVILHFIIIKNYPNLFSNYYPKSTIRVIYPFILNFGEFI